MKCLRQKGNLQMTNELPVKVWMTRLLTPKQLTERLQVSNATLRKWRMDGRGPSYIKMGDSQNAAVRYKLEDVQEWENSGHNDGGTS
jgi:predicted DNA-binding transcriptional regulator AlpA